MDKTTNVAMNKDIVNQHNWTSTNNDSKDMGKMLESAKTFLGKVIIQPCMTRANIHVVNLKRPII